MANIETLARLDALEHFQKMNDAEQLVWVAAFALACREHGEAFPKISRRDADDAVAMLALAFYP